MDIIQFYGEDDIILSNQQDKMNRLIDLTGFDKCILIKIADFGIIAGGSVVYALNKFVPKQSVGDIDIFVLNEDINIFHKLRGIISNATCCLSPEESKYHWEELEGEQRMKTATYNNSKGKPIQLILSKMKNPQELMNNFDLDYVKCYFHKGMFCVTEDCQKSHETKTITLPDNPNNDIEVRIQKARKKGFKTE